MSSESKHSVCNWGCLVRAFCYCGLRTLWADALQTGPFLFLDMLTLCEAPCLFSRSGHWLLHPHPRSLVTHILVPYLCIVNIYKID
jgi:hypothetical protein